MSMSSLQLYCSCTSARCILAADRHTCMATVGDACCWYTKIYLNNGIAAIWLLLPRVLLLLYRQGTRVQCQYHNATLRSFPWAVTCFRSKCQMNMHEIVHQIVNRCACDWVLINQQHIFSKLLSKPASHLYSSQSEPKQHPIWWKFHSRCMKLSEANCLLSEDRTHSTDPNLLLSGVVHKLGSYTALQAWPVSLGMSLSFELTRRLCSLACVLGSRWTQLLPNGTASLLAYTNAHPKMLQRWPGISLW